MYQLKIKTGSSLKEQALLLFDEGTGVLIAFYYLSENNVFEEPKGIWLIDMNSKFPLKESSESIMRLIKNVCGN